MQIRQRKILSHQRAMIHEVCLSSAQSAKLDGFNSACEFTKCHFSKKKVDEEGHESQRSDQIKKSW